uniref:RNA silencing suppressor n=1 Tax=Potato virus H TaxID=1046402 RepID=A0A346CP47_9VIRU|nr:cysteine rich protein [Potato virus H]
MRFSDKVLRKVLVSVFKRHYGCGPRREFLDIASYIISKLEPQEVGLSKYAKRRRAKKLGRCPRCYRVIGLALRCDGVRCVPGISYNRNVEQFIKYGEP